LLVFSLTLSSKMQKKMDQLVVTCSIYPLSLLLSYMERVTKQDLH